jgi:Co/Zn/Cd efflux system component
MHDEELMHDDESHCGHHHVHGAVDPSLLATQKGISTVKLSFIVLLATALIQVAAVSYTGSIALLADMIHHFGDALLLSLSG